MMAPWMHAIGELQRITEEVPAIVDAAPSMICPDVWDAIREKYALAKQCGERKKDGTLAALDAIEMLITGEKTS